MLINVDPGLAVKVRGTPFLLAGQLAKERKETHWPANNKERCSRTVNLSSSFLALDVFYSAGMSCRSNVYWPAEEDICSAKEEEIRLRKER